MAENAAEWGARADGRALASFARHYAQNVLSGIIFKAVILDIFKTIDAGDKPYFRESREKRIGATLEQFQIAPDVARAQMTQALSPLRALLKEQPFINGRRPAFADYCVFGAFMWARNVSTIRLIADDDPTHAWVRTSWRDQAIDPRLPMSTHRGPT